MTSLPLFDSTPPADPRDARRREVELLGRLGRLDAALVAFSGGVDSTYLAWAARQALGGRALAVTGISDSVPLHMRERASDLARRIGIEHLFVETREIEDPRYLENSPDRCYWCKDELFARLERLAGERGVAAVLDGTNADDLGDHRPGRRAGREHRVRSPLAEAGLGKAALRWLSREAGLPTWSEPASPCLSSRVPYGTAITTGMLRAIDEAEQVLRGLGFREFRVRHHGEVARIEIAAGEWARALDPERAARLAGGVRAAGFRYVTLDLEPFRSGRLNEAVGLGRASGGGGAGS